MATISQLMEGKVPGSVKVRLSVWTAGEFFTPYFYDSASGFWFGTSNAGNHEQWTDSTSAWTLYSEPKRKVAMYLWAVKTDDEDGTHQSFSYYPSEDALREVNPSITWCQRLDYTKIEVEEDGE